MRFQEGEGDWTEYRKLPDIVEDDFHWADFEDPDMSYYDKMEEVHSVAFDKLKTAYERGIPYVLFTHGHSTSRRGKTTARSIIRTLMRSPKATPYLVRSKSIQHYSVFVAALRPNPEGRQAYEAQLAVEWKQLCKEYHALVDKMTSPKHREMSHTYPDFLEEDEGNKSKRNSKLQDQISNYKDQYERRVGIFGE